MSENEENRSLYSYSKDEIHQDNHLTGTEESRTDRIEEKSQKQNSWQEGTNQTEKESAYHSYQADDQNKNNSYDSYNTGSQNKNDSYDSYNTGSRNKDYSYDSRFQSRQERKAQKKNSGGEKKFGKTGKFVGKCVAAGLIFGLVSSVTFSGVTGLLGKDTNQTQTSSTNSSEKTALLTTASGNSSNDKVSTDSDTTGTTTALDVSSVVSAVMPSIVSINSTFESEGNYFGTSGEYSGAGSGIIVAQTDGTMYIATNNHVVSGATKVTINFYGDEDNEVEAEVKGTDSSNDLAVLSVNISDIPSDTLSNLKVATLGDSDSVKVGQTAIAIGNALGYGQSVTTGVISALNREITIDNETYTLIQTDAAINPGNSGGALLNADGQVIAINSAKFSDTQVEGMGYAIPISTAVPIINELISREAVSDDEASYLGIAGIDVSDSVSEVYGMPEGVYISQVIEGEAAKAAGVQEGDILTEFDGHAISSMSELQELMQYYAAGTTVDVKVERAENGQYTEKTISVTLGKKPASSQTDSSDSSSSGSDNSTMPNGQNQRNGR